MFRSLFRYISGYAAFMVSGGFGERFINICSKNGVLIWDIKRRGKDIECKCRAGDYKRLCSLRRPCHVKLKLKDKQGLPFHRRRYRLRLGIPAGAVMFFALLWFLSSSVWNITVSGNVQLSEKRIVSALENIGITYGTRLSDIDAVNARIELMLALPELSWASINIRGSTAEVEVREAMEKSEPGDKTPCNLRARIDGVILGFRVNEGQLAAKVGDAVREGDLLVSGTKQLNDGRTELVHSDGEVMALTQHTLQYKATYQQRSTERTGRMENRRVLCFFGLNIPLYLGSIKYPYQKETNRTYIEANDVKLPIYIAGAAFYETYEKTYTVNGDAAERIARARIEQMIIKDLEDIKIVERESEVFVDDQGVTVVERLIGEQNIAVKENILISSSLS